MMLSKKRFRLEKFAPGCTPYAAHPVEKLKKRLPILANPLILFAGATRLELATFPLGQAERSKRDVLTGIEPLNQFS